MNGTTTARRVGLLAAWTLPLGLALGSWRPIQRLAQDRRAAVDFAYASQGESLLYAVHDSHEDIAYHLPLDPLFEALLLFRGGSRPGQALILGVCLTGLGLLFVLGGFLGPAWFAWLCTALGSPWLTALPPDRSYKTFLCVVYVLLAAAAVVHRALRPSLKSDLVLALTLGSSLVLRSFLAFFLPLLAAYEFVFVHRFSLRAAWKPTAILCLTPCLFVLPWARMNRQVYHRFIPFEHQEASINVVSGALGLVLGGEGDWRQIVGDTGDPLDTPILWAVKYVLRHPFSYAWGYARRLWFAFRHYPLTWLAASAALWLNRRRPEIRQLGLFCGYYIMIHCTLALNPIFFSPLGPILAVLAASLLLAMPGLPLPAGPTLEKLSARLLAPAVIAALAAGAATAAVVNGYARAAARRTPWSNQALDEAFVRAPQDPWLRYARGETRLRAGLFAGAAEDLAEALSRTPELPRARLDLALAKALAGRPAALLGEPDEVSSWPNSEDMIPHVYKAVLYGRLKDSKNAGLQLEKALDFWRLGARVRFPKKPGEIALDAALRRGAEARFVEHLPQLPLTEADLAALAAGVSRRYPVAVPAPAAAAPVPPPAARSPQDRGPAARLRAAVLLAKQGRLDAALAALAALAAERPDDPDVWIEQADAARRAGRKELALGSAEKARGLRLDADRRRRVASLLEDSGAFDDAIAMLESLTKDGPGSAAAWSDLGVAQFRAGRPGPAADSLRAALRLDSGYLEAALSLGAILESQGSLQQAVAVYDEALSQAAATQPLRAQVAAARAQAARRGAGRPR